MYEIEVIRGPRGARVVVTGADGAEIAKTTVRVSYADLNALGGPERATIGWPSSGAGIGPQAAMIVAEAIRRAVGIATASDKRPLGFAPRFTTSDARLAVDTPEAAELLTAKRGATGPLAREDAERGFWPYAESARWSWELGEPVYAVGMGASVLYDVPESKMTELEVTA